MPGTTSLFKWGTREPHSTIQGGLQEKLSYRQTQMTDEVPEPREDVRMGALDDIFSAVTLPVS